MVPDFDRVIFVQTSGEVVLKGGPGKLAVWVLVLFGYLPGRERGYPI